MPPMAPPERDLDDEETSVGVEGAWEPAEVSSAVVVVGAAVVAVDEGVVEEGVVEGAWEVVSVAAIKAWGLKDQEVASGSAALRDEYVLLRTGEPMSRSTSRNLLQQTLIWPLVPVHDSLITTALASRSVAAGGGERTNHWCSTMRPAWCRIGRCCHRWRRSLSRRSTRSSGRNRRIVRLLGRGSRLMGADT